jgi:hypothetical protein
MRRMSHCPATLQVRGGPARPRRASLAAALAASAVALAAVASVLGATRIERPLPPGIARDGAIDAAAADAGRRNIRAIRPLWVASGAGWAALGAVWMILRRAPAAAGPGRPGAVCAVVLSVATAARVAVIVAHEPALSDDVYRYLLDGRAGAAGMNPYLSTPAEWRGAHHGSAHSAELAALVNNPELHTIYLPVSQWAFALAARIAGPGSTPASAARVLRALLVGLELGAIALLLAILLRSGHSPWWAVLYAWHPLALCEVAGSGHQDVLGIALLLAAMRLSEEARGGAWAWVVPLSFGALVKPVVVPVAAFVLRGRPPRQWVLSAAVGACACALAAAPLWLTHGTQPLRNLMATGERFVLTWAHFGSVYEALLAATGALAPGWCNDAQELFVRRICGAAVLGVFLWLLLRRRGDLWSRACALLLAMVLLSPAAHPWYLLWALCLLPMARNPAVWVASLTLPWGYAALGDPAGWRVAPWVFLAAYAPVYGVLAVASMRHRPWFPDLGRRGRGGPAPGDPGGGGAVEEGAAG